jgi:hypothetical protein
VTRHRSALGPGAGAGTAAQVVPLPSLVLFRRNLRRKSPALAIFSKANSIEKVITHPCRENTIFLPCKRICSFPSVLEDWLTESRFVIRERTLVRLLLRQSGTRRNTRVSEFVLCFVSVRGTKGLPHA